MQLKPELLIDANPINITKIVFDSSNFTSFSTSTQFHKVLFKFQVFFYFFLYFFFFCLNNCRVSIIENRIENRIELENRKKLDER